MIRDSERMVDMENAGPQEKPNVYIVDGDTSILRALERLLRSAGYSAFTFTSAEEFLLSRKAAEKGILILDIRLPGMDGFELQEHLAERGAEYSVIFITAHDNHEWRERGKKAGAVAYLSKPFPEQTLLDAIHLA